MTTITETDEGVLLYLHLSDDSPSEEAMLDDKPVIWKDVLVEGKYPMTPTGAGAVEKELTVVASGESSASKGIIAMSDLVAAHEDQAFKYVTIPTTHRDGVLDNTGYVPRPGGLRVVEKADHKVMQAALGFTEPDVKGKVKRGTIPDVSAGIFFSWLNKHTKKRYRAAMKHVALTPVPFMGNLEPFPAVFASDDDINEDTPVQFFSFDDSAPNDGTGVTPPDPGSTDESKKGEIVWNETTGLNWIRDQVSTALNPEPSNEDGPTPIRRAYYSVQDVSNDGNALVTEYFKGESRRFIIPFTVEDTTVSISPATRWVEAREAMIAASDENFEELSTDTLREKLSVLLSEQIGPTASSYRIDELTLDKRVRISSTVDDAAWVAAFDMSPNGEVFLASQWESIDAPEPEKPDVKQHTSAPTSVKLDDNSLEGRLAAARQRRKTLVSSASR